jgi:hypothetical protein
MIKRPLNPRFSQAVLDGRKTTTIRDSFWPCDVPIMLYNWSGAAYRSKQVNVAPVMVQCIAPIRITHKEDGDILYVWGRAALEYPPLYETEGFASRAEMDAWFRPLIKPGQTAAKILMRFSLHNDKLTDAGTKTL